MEDFSNIDWNEVSNVVDATKLNESGKPVNDATKANIYLKLAPGFHNLRIVPAGNPVEKLPFIELRQHTYNTYVEGRKSAPQFILCWNYLWDKFNLKKTDQEKKENTLISYLGNISKKMTQEDFNKYLKNGCQWCKAVSHLKKLGVDNMTQAPMYARDSYFFNFLNRQDHKVYVWSLSKQKFNMIMMFAKHMKDTDNINVFDPMTGRDIILQATGNGFGGTNGRKYPMFQFVGTASPLGMGEQTHHNLLEIAESAYKPYQDAINHLKIANGETLSKYAFIPDGDMSFASEDPNNTPFTPSNQITTILNNQPQVVTVTTPTKVDKGNGYFEIDGVLYDPTGKKLF